MQSIDSVRFELLLRDARIKPKLIRELRFIPEQIDDWQDRDFIAVTNRSRSAGVLIYPDYGEPIPFTLQRRRPNAVGRVEPILCDICATWRRGTESATITFAKERSTATFFCCDDLLCSFHVRDRTEAAILSRTQLRENINAEARVTRLGRRLSSLLRGILQT